MMSGLFVGLMLLVIALAVFAAPPAVEPFAWYGSMAVLPAVVLVATALFAVRGYRVEPGVVLVVRPFWTTRVSLAELSSATAEPEATAKSMRVFGNGGAFAYSGRFRNATLGMYRVLGTDLEKSVVLRFTSGVPMVLTPGEPAQFVDAVSAAANLPS